MTYILIDKCSRVLNRKANVIWMATYMECVDTYHPGTIAYASMLTGKIDEYYSIYKVFKITKESFTSKCYSGTWHERLVLKLSLVKGKPGNIISMAEYCGRI